MHMNCYVCENDLCQTRFAIDSLSDGNGGDITCPNCGDDVTDTGEVVVNPSIIGRKSAINMGYI